MSDQLLDEEPAINIYDRAVGRVTQALGVSTNEAERVALSWEGNAGFCACKLLEAARKKVEEAR